MPTWLKVLLIVFLIGVAIVLAGVYAAYRWFDKNKDSLKREAEQVQKDAREFAEGKDSEACVAESLNRLKSSDGLMSEMKLQVFLSTCLQQAQEPAEFCSSIPRRSEIIASTKWTMAECGRRGFPNDQRCQRLMGALMDHCERSRAATSTQ